MRITKSLFRDVVMYFIHVVIMLLVHYWKGHLVFCFGNITHIVRLEDNKSSRSICVCVGTNKHHRCINMIASPLNFGVLKALQSVGTSSVFVWVYYYY